MTNLRHAPARVYGEVYAGRGDSENRLKELHHGLECGRTSCSRFWANQLRVTLTAAAYVLMQELQLRADRTTLARAQVPRLRLTLLKIGVHVVCSVRRIVLHLPRAHPDPEAWQQIARGLGAVRPLTSSGSTLARRPVARRVCRDRRRHRHERRASSITVRRVRHAPSARPLIASVHQFTRTSSELVNNPG